MVLNSLKKGQGDLLLFFKEGDGRKASIYLVSEGLVEVVGATDAEVHNVHFRGDGIVEGV